MTARIKDLAKKYGKLAIGVHLSVSAASITGLYVAIKNNVDVESIFEKYNLPGFSKDAEQSASLPQQSAEVIDESADPGRSTAVVVEQKSRNRTAELASSTGGALALAVLVNKALFPIRVPITIALTPPVSRFLARRKFFNGRV